MLLSQAPALETGEPIVPVSTSCATLSLHRLQTFFDLHPGQACDRIVLALVAPDGTASFTWLYQGIQKPLEAVPESSAPRLRKKIRSAVQHAQPGARPDSESGREKARAKQAWGRLLLRVRLKVQP